MRRSVRDGIVTLTNIRTVYDRKGRARRYVQVKGHKLIPLPDAPMDSPEFLSAWSAAMKKAKGVTPRPGVGTISALCTAFLRSPAFKAHSASYQSILRRPRAPDHGPERDQRHQGLRHAASLQDQHGPRKRLAIICRVWVLAQIAPQTEDRGLLDAEPAAEFIRGHGRLLLDPGLALDGAVCGDPPEAFVPDALLGHLAHPASMRRISRPPVTTARSSGEFAKAAA